MKTEAGRERFGEREILPTQLARGAPARPPSFSRACCWVRSGDSSLHHTNPTISAWIPQFQLGKPPPAADLVCFLVFPQCLEELFHAVKEMWFSREVDGAVPCSEAHVTAQIQKPRLFVKIDWPDSVKSMQEWPWAEIFFWGRWRLPVLQIEPITNIHLPAPSYGLSTITGEPDPSVLLRNKTLAGLFQSNKTSAEYETNIFVLEKDCPTPPHTHICTH